jgi:PEP-CTERM motif
MKRGLLVSLACLAFGLLSATVSAGPIPVGNGITVTCLMSDLSACTLVGPLQWSIPEVQSDTTQQPAIFLLFNVPFVTTGRFNILDPSVPGGLTCPPTGYPSACISDQLRFNPPSSTVSFYSDPSDLISLDTTLPVGCQEDTVVGCSFQKSIQTQNGPVTFVVFSDGNPTSTGTVSDTIQILTPEPTSVRLVLLGIGMLTLGWKRRR